MKKFAFFSLFSLILFCSISVSSVFAQSSSADDGYKKDTTITAILASHTHSVTDCGNDPSTDDDPPFIIIIFEEIEPGIPADVSEEGIEGS